MTAGASRSAELDVLRAVAVTAVLVEHAPFAFSGLAGWSGVDLFFVLSGFLVSGLLFAEQQAHGRVRIGRFLVRRGFKIYPAFYLMIGATVALRLLHSGTVPLRAAVSELLFVQNYGPRLWMHTWSLAVEEHFYLALALWLGWLARSRHPRAFGSVPAVVVAVALAVLAARVLTVWVWEPAFERVMYATHLRIDALLCGVGISYACHYHRAWLDGWLAGRAVRVALWVLAVACLAPVLLVSPVTKFILGPGLTLSYLGYGTVLLLVLPAATDRRRRGAIVRGVAFVGRHSYSIYLWHVPILLWIFAPLAAGRVALWHGGFWPWGFAFVVCAIAGGIGLAHLVEFPMLALRERLFPRPSESAPLQT